MAILPEVIQSPLAGTGVGTLGIADQQEGSAIPPTPPTKTSDAKFDPSRPNNVISVQQQKELVKAYQEKGLDPMVGLEMLVQDGKQLEGYDSSLRAWNTANQQEKTELPDANLLSRGVSAIGLPVVNAIRKRMGKDKVSFDDASKEFQKTAFKDLGGVPQILGGAAQSVTSVPTDIVGALVGVVDKDTGQMIQDKGDITNWLQKGGMQKGGWFDVAKFATDTGMTLAAGTRIINGIKSITGLTKFAKAYPKRHTGLTAGTEGLIDTHIASILGEGEFAGIGESIGGTALGAVVPGAGALLGKARGGLKSIATKLQLQGLLPPRKLQEVQGQLQELGVTLKNKKQIAAQDIVSQLDTLDEAASTDVKNKLNELGAAIADDVPLTADELSKQLDGFSSTKLREIKKELKKLGVDVKLNDTIADDVSGFMFDRGIVGTERQMVDKLEDVAFTSSQKLEEGLKGLGSFKGTEAIDDAIFEYKRLVESTGGGRLLKDIPKKLALLETKSAQGTLSLNDVQALKAIGDKVKSPFKAFGDVKSSVEAEGFALLRKQLKEFIENQAKKLKPGFDVKELNKEIQIANTLKEAITRKEAHAQLRAILRASSPGVAAGGIAGATGEGNIVQRLKRIVLFGVIGGLGGKLIQNKSIQSNVAKHLNKLSDAEMISVEKFIQSKGQGDISDKLLDVLSEIRESSVSLAISAGLITNEDNF